MSQIILLDFVDTETTGVIDDEPDAEITEIAIVQWSSDEGKTEERLHAIVRPKKGMPDKNRQYNASYDDAANAAADSWDVHASKEISELLAGRMICGSNPDFDKRMIAAECFRTGQPRPKWNHRGVNTCALGMMLWIMGETNGAGLGHLTKAFGIEHKAHTALGGCYAAIAVWEAFFDRFIFRPAKMKAALEELKNCEARDFDKSTIQIAADLAEFCNAALVCE